jgi:hypothetical protein
MIWAKPIAQSSRGSRTSHQRHKKKNLLQRPGGAGHKLKAYLSLTLRQSTVTMREKWYGHAEYEMTLNNQSIRDWANPW